MIRAFLFSMLSLFSIVSLAGPVEAEAQKKVKGIDEKVTIESFGSSWGYTFKMYGFYEGTASVDIIPVTPKAAGVLQALDKQKKYNCVILNSTYVEKNKAKVNYQDMGGQFFVLDINCD